MFHLQTNGNFQKFFVNGKLPEGKKTRFEPGCPVRVHFDVFPPKPREEER